MSPDGGAPRQRERDATGELSPDPPVALACAYLAAPATRGERICRQRNDGCFEPFRAACSY